MERVDTLSNLVSRFKIQEALFIPREIAVQQLQYKSNKENKTSKHK